MNNGIDTIKTVESLFKGRRIGLITNPSGVTRDLRLTADVLASEFNVTALFGPEHGIRGDAQAGAVVTDYRDNVLDIPVFSLFGPSKRIPQDAFNLIDILAYDIQDVGARFYTYIYTLAMAMEDAARAGKPVVVFDRVNPLGGESIEGILLDHKHLSSFVGMYPIPTRYGLTVGEFARYINKEFNINCDLIIIPCDIHPRGMLFPRTGLPWVPPSPNIPTFETALAYIGTCIFEGTNVSEGRGTTKPFEMIGAPFIDAQKLLSRLDKHRLPGIAWRPVHFTPMFSKFSGELCHGVQLYVKNPRTAHPFEAGLWLCQEIRDLCPDDFKFNKQTFSRLLGSESFVSGKESAEEIITRARTESYHFWEETLPYRLY